MLVGEKYCSKRTLFFLSFSLVESSLKNLSYVLMSFKDNTNEQLIILSKPSSIYRVVLFLTKPKPSTNRITISILPNRIGNQIKRIIPILFQVGIGHGPLTGTWAIAQQTPPLAKGPKRLQVEDLLTGFLSATLLQNSWLSTMSSFHLSLWVSNMI